MVVGIIAILAGVVLAVVNPDAQKKRSQDAVLTKAVADIGATVENYNTLRGRYPNADSPEDLLDFQGFLKGFTVGGDPGGKLSIVPSDLNSPIKYKGSVGIVYSPTSNCVYAESNKSEEAAKLYISWTSGGGVFESAEACVP